MGAHLPPASGLWALWLDLEHQTLRAGSLQLLIDGVLLQSVSVKIHCLAVAQPDSHFGKCGQHQSLSTLIVSKPACIHSYQV